MRKEQNIQDSEYCFPYHYIPVYKNGFTTTLSWHWGTHYIGMVEFILHKLTAIKFNSLLDIGSGDGRLTREIAAHFKNKHIFGIDRSQKAIALAKALNPQLSFKQLDIVKDKVSIRTDVITLIEVLEHIPKVQISSFVAAHSKILRKNGFLLLSVPHVNIPLSDKHYQHFTVSLLEKIFSKTFSFEEVIFIDKKSLFFRLLKKLMINSLFILNNRTINTLFYKIYKKYFFITKENHCERIFVKLRKK